MCGIVCAVSKRNVASMLIEGLKRLEYRGYDSAGLAILSPDKNELQRIRTLGKVQQLAQAIKAQSMLGSVGIAHTRWATHGAPSEQNAHPQMSADLALVHNGIVENHREQRTKLLELGYTFTSDTDTEVIVHMVHYYRSKGASLIDALRKAIGELKGAMAIGVISSKEGECLAVACKGAPLVIGRGLDEYLVASDQVALQRFAKTCTILEDGDCALITRDEVLIIDQNSKAVRRPWIKISVDAISHADKGGFKHFMLKEIFEQPKALATTIEGRFSNDQVLTKAFGYDADILFKKIDQVYISACGTSYHAGMVAKYWIEEIANIPCHVEIASEYRYRKLAKLSDNTLFIAVSQSGETADTLAALKMSKELPFLERMAICNVASSTLARLADRTVLTRAGREIGVASTKAFTTQLIVFLNLALLLAKYSNPTFKQADLIQQILQLPKLIEEVLLLNDKITSLATLFAKKRNALFLGRGLQYPIAMEGALKLKEISYIHAEAYPSGELKHGALALIDKDMPVVAIVPNDKLLEKIVSNLQEVKCRGGELFVFTDEKINWHQEIQAHTIDMPSVHPLLAPILYTIPLQLLAYNVAYKRGTDIDQPRNLAKSVTVE